MPKLHILAERISFSIPHGAKPFRSSNEKDNTYRALPKLYDPSTDTLPG